MVIPILLIIAAVAIVGLLISLVRDWDRRDAEFMQQLEERQADIPSPDEQLTYEPHFTDILSIEIPPQQLVHEQAEFSLWLDNYRRAEQMHCRMMLGKLEKHWAGNSEQQKRIWLSRHNFEQLEAHARAAGVAV